MLAIVKKNREFVRIFWGWKLEHYVSNEKTYLICVLQNKMDPDCSQNKKTEPSLTKNRTEYNRRMESVSFHLDGLLFLFHRIRYRLWYQVFHRAKFSEVFTEYGSGWIVWCLLRYCAAAAAGHFCFQQAVLPHTPHGVDEEKELVVSCPARSTYSPRLSSAIISAISSRISIYKRMTTITEGLQPDSQLRLYIVRD